MPHKDPERRREWERNRPHRDRRAEHKAYYRKTHPGVESMPKTQCVRGHELSEENVYLRPSGVRECRVCKTEARRAERANLTEEQKAQRRITARVRSAERRARKRKMFVERVDPQVVFERDEGVCGICNEPVDRNDYDIDHVIPLDPGEHSYANSQLAHPLCNQKKARKMLDQLVGLPERALAST